MWIPKSFTEVSSRLEHLKNHSLPGLDAQLKMAPIGRRKLELEEINRSKAKKAAVLMLLVNHQDQPHVVLTKRTEYPGVHSGQISLPGGKKEESDPDFQYTALRETEEEIGVSSKNIEVLGALSELYIPPSNFLVQPYLGLSRKELIYKAEEIEVQEIITVDLNLLFHDNSMGNHHVEARGNRFKVPAFRVENHIIWGATAMMLSELREILQ